MRPSPTAREFVGSGWGFPLRTDATGGLALVSDEREIEEAIRLILGTAYGERPMRPEFGCGIHDLVFAVANSATLGAVARTAREALIRWEPRIEVQRVDAVIDPGAPTRLLVRVDYRVRTTNNQFNLVYPFYLERSAQ